MKTFSGSIPRLLAWVIFLIFFYNVLHEIFIFVGIQGYVVKMYLFWFVIIMFFASVLPINKIDL